MPLPQSIAKLPARTLLRHFSIVFLIAATVLTVVIAAVAQLDVNLRLERTKVREAAHIEIAKNRVLQDFSSVALDLHIIERLPALQRYLDGGAAAQRDELIRFFLLLSKESARYDQIRYLDLNGQEVVRVNFNDGRPVVVPAGELQNKAGRYFFRDTLKLGRSEIFISPLDLNIEHDKLEIPYKPMIRFGMPVFDSAGHKKGIILLNYFGSQLLQDFRDSMSGGDQRLAMLLNRDGFWLSSPKAEDAWGFMLNQPERVFARDFPDEWRTIAMSDSGTLRSSAGLLTYATIRPLQSGQRSSSGSPLPQAPSQHELGRSEYHWKIVSIIPADVLQERALHNQRGVRVLTVSAYLSLALVAFLIAYLNLKRRQSADSLRVNETRLREITTTMSDGLMVIGQDGRILFANPEACLLLGYAADELLGTDMHTLLHVNKDGSPAARAECPVLNIARNGATYRGVEEMFRRKDGTLLPVSVSASAVHRERHIGDIVIAFHDISERKQFERELEHRAHTDVLTGLNNRRYFYELAEHEFVRAKRYATPLAALMLDVDHFKRINDSHGHHAGDAVLQKLSEVCLKTLRENDIVGRFGGEEFAILLPEADGTRAAEVAERLRIAVASAAIPLEGKVHFRFFVSIGVATMNASDENIDDMLKRADAALYAAKNAGRNRVVCAPDTAAGAA
ncbi:MAG TPA: diguanylate cyclase [Sideroxyarcus sp.]|nr:diguanylate cyclase [Sideroxyarcus sp.]